MRTVMGHSFNQVPTVELSRSKFDRSHGHKTSFDIGELIPCYVDEALPGDTFMMDVACFGRMASPLEVPMLDNIYFDVHFFSVPMRLLWTNFPKFMGEQTDPGDSTDYTIPQLDINGINDVGADLADYFGLPINATTTGTCNVNSLPFRAYNLIYNEWYRDQNLIDSLTVEQGDGPDTPANYEIQKRAKRRDYFTGCLPWPQKGTAISLPLGTQAPVTGIGKANNTWITGPVNAYETGASTYESYAKYADSTGASVDNRFYFEEDPNNTGYPNIYADLTNATSATINQLREALAQQRMLERDARGGTRYIEMIESHFGVRSPDGRQQRPEYLGGATFPLNVHDVAQTSEDATNGDVGQLSAHATMAQSGNGFTASFTEHSYLIGIISARADITYQQGIDRLWNRSTRYDFYWPELARIGEQEVLNKEIWYDDGTPANNDNTFGYVPRNDEYRFHKSLITGQMRTASAVNFDEYHLSESFASAPSLNQTFIEDQTPMDRIKKVTANTPDFLMDMFFSLQCVRPMPIHGVPGMVGHL